jgi:hypothetical protein
VTEFPELKGVLRAWAIAAISRLSAGGDAHDSWMDFGRWRRDSDGIFRDIDREVRVAIPARYHPLARGIGVVVLAMTASMSEEGASENQCG